MNVDVVFARNDIVVPECSEVTWKDLLNKRLATFTGFAQIEGKRGFVEPKVSFSSSKGQEMLRIMFFRVLEEASESYDSGTDNHFKEEAIDALNYLFSAVMLDPTYFSVDVLSPFLTELTTSLEWKGQCLTLADLGSFTFQICGKLADTFRSRSWMENDQNPYFEGANEIRETLKIVGMALLQCFSSWDEFYRFYEAKDQVLQFRLNTTY